MNGRLNRKLWSLKSATRVSSLGKVRCERASNLSLFTYVCRIESYVLLTKKNTLVEFTIMIGMLLLDISNVPYHVQSKQFKRAYIWGSPENCSVDWCLMILLNVGIVDTNRPIAKMLSNRTKDRAERKNATDHDKIKRSNHREQSKREK